MHDCKYAESLKNMCDAAMVAAYKNNDMAEFDHILHHLCTAIALLFANIKYESRIMALHYIVTKTDEAEKMVDERIKALKEALENIPDDKNITPEVIAKAQEALKNMREQPKH